MILLLQVWGNQSALNPHGPVAGRLAEMSWVWIFGFGFVWLITMIILGLALLRGRGNRFLGDAGSRRLVLVAGLAVPAVVLVSVLVYSVLIGRTLYARPYAKRGALVIQVEGKQWWWQVSYLQGSQIFASTANEIHIPVGQPVVFKLESHDVIHSFWVPSLAGKLDLIPGRSNEMWLQADHPGIYRGQCAEYCGAQHAHMGFEVIAEPPDQFGRWLELQRMPAVEPSNDAQRRGQQIFLQGPCAMCHAVRGTAALASFGPDLTHVGGRRTIAAATLPNNRGSLGGWISDSQGVKPGSHMPRINLPSNDLDPLLTWLESLK